MWWHRSDALPNRTRPVETRAQPRWQAIADGALSVWVGALGSSPLLPRRHSAARSWRPRRAAIVCARAYGHRAAPPAISWPGTVGLGSRGDVGGQRSARHDSRQPGGGLPSAQVLGVRDSQSWGEGSGHGPDRCRLPASPRAQASQARPLQLLGSPHPEVPRVPAGRCCAPMYRCTGWGA